MDDFLTRHPRLGRAWDVAAACAVLTRLAAARLPARVRSSATAVVEWLRVRHVFVAFAVGRALTIAGAAVAVAHTLGVAAATAATGVLVAGNAWLSSQLVWTPATTAEDGDR